MRDCYAKLNEAEVRELNVVCDDLRKDAVATQDREMNKKMKTYNTYEEVYAPRYDVFYRDAANELEMKTFPMMKGDPDHKAFNDAIAFAGFKGGKGLGCTIESRRYDKAKNRWDIERVWPDKTSLGSFRGSYLESKIDTTPHF